MIPLGILAAAGGDYDPANEGAVLSHYSDAGHVTKADGMVIVSTTDPGSAGGSYVGGTNGLSPAVTVDGLSAAAFRDVRRSQHNGTITDFNRLQNGTEDATFIASFSVFDVSAGTNKYLYCTYNGGSTITGFLVFVKNTGQVNVWFGNGAGSEIAVSTVTVTDGNHFDLVVTKSGADYTIAVNGETPIAGTIPTPSVTNCRWLPSVGNNQTAGYNRPFEGLIPEVWIYSEELDAPAIARVRAHLAAKWDKTPDTHPILRSEIHAWWRMDTGVTDNSGAEFVEDLSGHENQQAQGTVSSRMAIISSWRNGHNGLQGASGDRLQKAPFEQGSQAQAHTVYTVLGWASSAGTQVPIDGGTVSTRASIYDSGSEISINGGTVLAGGSQPGNGTPTILRSTFDGVSTDVRAEPHGESVITFTGDGGTDSVDGFTIGSDYTGSNSFTGEIAELLCVDGTPTAPSDAAQFSEMSDYWDIVHS